MKRMLLLSIVVSSLFICGCINEEAKQLQSKFNEEIKVETQYKRGKKAKVAATQYAEMEHNLNNKFVTDLSLMIENSFEKQLEEFEDEELGIFSNIGYALELIFVSEKKRNEKLSLKANKYFNTMDVEQEALNMYRNHVSEIQKLRSSFYTNKKNVNMAENIYLDLPKETIDLGGMQKHTVNNMVMAFSEGILGWVIAFILGFIISFLLALFGIFVETEGCFVKGIGSVVVIITFVGMIVLSIRNDNKVLDY
jgi:outer membrane murein-binding lipoprotein Lpp